MNIRQGRLCFVKMAFEIVIITMFCFGGVVVVFLLLSMFLFRNWPYSSIPLLLRVTFCLCLMLIYEGGCDRNGAKLCKLIFCYIYQLPALHGVIHSEFNLK